jgi:hypothetical protein
MTEVLLDDLRVLEADGSASEDTLQELLSDDPDDVRLAFLGHRFETYGEVPTSSGSCGSFFCVACASCITCIGPF